jgi:hypothetical protein
VPPESGGAPIADALLVQLIQDALGRTEKTRRLPWPNISSCKFVVTLRSRARGLKERYFIEGVARQVPGVLGVVNKIRVTRAL